MEEAGLDPNDAAAAESFDGYESDDDWQSVVPAPSGRSRPRPRARSGGFGPRKDSLPPQLGGGPPQPPPRPPKREQPPAFPGFDLESIERERRRVKALMAMRLSEAKTLGQLLPTSVASPPAAGGDADGTAVVTANGGGAAAAAAAAANGHAAHGNGAAAAAAAATQQQPEASAAGALSWEGGLYSAGWCRRLVSDNGGTDGGGGGGERLAGGSGPAPSSSTAGGGAVLGGGGVVMQLVQVAGAGHRPTDQYILVPKQAVDALLVPPAAKSGSDAAAGGADVEEGGVLLAVEVPGSGGVPLVPAALLPHLMAKGGKAVAPVVPQVRGRGSARFRVGSGRRTRSVRPTSLAVLAGPLLVPWHSISVRLTATHAQCVPLPLLPASPHPWLACSLPRHATPARLAGRAQRVPGARHQGAEEAQHAQGSGRRRGKGEEAPATGATHRPPGPRQAFAPLSLPCMIARRP